MLTMFFTVLRLREIEDIITTETPEEQQQQSMYIRKPRQHSVYLTSANKAWGEVFRNHPVRLSVHMSCKQTPLQG